MPSLLSLNGIRVAVLKTKYKIALIPSSIDRTLNWIDQTKDCILALIEHQSSYQLNLLGITTERTSSLWSIEHQLRLSRISTEQHLILLFEQIVSLKLLYEIVS